MAAYVPEAVKNCTKPSDNGWPVVASVTVPETVARASDTGVTEFDGPLAGPGPALFVAVTVNVYDVPLLNAITVHDNAPLVQPHVAPPGLATTV